MSIYPGAEWRPGAAAGYAWGRNQMRSCVAHFTVGRDSTAIGLRGMFTFLVTRDGRVLQFCEADARCGHAGDPYNTRGPGIEVEYLPGYDDEMFTPAARAACGELVDWLVERGIRDAYYDDPANRVGDWDGFISHRSVVSNAALHSDYWDQADWVAMRGPIDEPEEEDMAKGVYVFNKDDGGTQWVLTSAGTKYRVWSADQGTILYYIGLTNSPTPGGISGEVCNLFRDVHSIAAPTDVPGTPGACQFKPAPTTFKAV